MQQRARTVEAKDKRRQALLAAALDAFFERGFTATRMDDIATLAGVSKGALASLTTYLAVELAPRGIRVNAVTSGLVDGSDGIRMLDEQLLERYREVAPAGRLVKPEEVASAVAFLCSEEASMIIGHVLTVDGGYSLVGLL